MGLYNVFLILHSSCLIDNGLKELLELCADARKRYRDEDAPPADGVKRASSVEQKVVRFKKSLQKYFSATAVHIWITALDMLVEKFNGLLLGFFTRLRFSHSSSCLQ